MEMPLSALMPAPVRMTNFFTSISRHDGYSSVSNIDGIKRPVEMSVFPSFYSTGLLIISSSHISIGYHFGQSQI